MAKITIDCSDPNDLAALESAIEEAVGKCNVTYFKQAQELQEAGVVLSERAAARKIAEETGEPVPTVRSRIKAGKKEVDEASSTTESVEKTSTSAKLEKLEKPAIEINHAAFNRVVESAAKEKASHGGARPRAGRKPKQKKETEPIPYVSSNNQIALMAILQLDRIDNDDRDEAIAALGKVSKWIQNRLDIINNIHGGG